jgi:hypothetical protein
VYQLCLCLIGRGWQACSVGCMTSCRATSFYVAPGVQRYFAEATLATRESDGSWVEFTHRKDLERYAEAHDEWDGVCFIGPAGGVSVLADALIDSPVSVERWTLDSRVINGRSPGGPTQTLLALAAGGVAKAGGVSQLTERLFAGANRPLRDAVETACGRNGGAYALSVAVALRGLVGDDRTAGVLNSAVGLDLAPLDSRTLDSFIAEMSRRYSKERVATLVASLAGWDGLSDYWHELAAVELIDDPERLAELGRGGTWGMRMAVMRNPVTPPDVLLEALGSDDHFLRGEVAGNVGATGEMLLIALADASSDVAHNAVLNPAAGAGVLLAGTGHPEWLVRCGVMQNPNTTADILAIGLADSDGSVRKAALGNPNITPELIALGWTDQNGEVRAAAVRSDGVPADILAAGMTDEEGYVRAGAYQFNKLTEEELLVGAGDPEYTVRAGVMYNEGATEAVLRLGSSDQVFNTRVAAICHPNAPLDVIEAGSSHERADVRAAAMSNPNVPAALLAEHVDDDDAYVRLVVMQSPNATREMLIVGSGDPDVSVWWAACSNPVLDAQTRYELLAAHRDDDARFIAMEMSLSGEVIGVRVAHPAAARLDEVALISSRSSAAVSSVGGDDGESAWQPEWPERPKSVWDLPGRDAAPWALEPKVELVDGALVSDGDLLTTRVIRSAHELRTNATYMGNCTTGMGTVLAEGTSLLMALEDEHGRTRYNAELFWGMSGWTVTEVNTRFNGGGVPEDVTAQLSVLAAKLSERRIEDDDGMDGPSLR